MSWGIGKQVLESVGFCQEFTDFFVLPSVGGQVLKKHQNSLKYIIIKIVTFFEFILIIDL